MKKEIERRERIKLAMGPLCEWYQKNHRELPWRSEVTPYHVWISEIMLQQTRVEAVKPYYVRFLNCLPDIPALAQVDDDILMKLWEGLGYYSRARNLKKAAILCCEQYDGNLPQTYEELLELPGIGSYTAGAISSIAYGLPVAAVDGNVLRVISRLTGDNHDIGLAATKKAMETELSTLLRESMLAPDILNQGLMELGALMCLPNGTPICEKCPWQEFCVAHLEGRTKEIPVKAPKKRRKVEEWTVFVVNDGDMTAIKKRGETGLLAGLYEFPMTLGHLTQEEATDWWRDLGYDVVLRELKPAKHIFSHIEWHMKGYEVKFVQADQGQVAESRGTLMFVSKAQLKDIYSIPGAFKEFMSIVM
ncbi:MAG: A/G-specific adenine glycosylase [Lachnospiraceae bacterium]